MDTDSRESITLHLTMIVELIRSIAEDTTQLHMLRISPSLKCNECHIDEIRENYFASLPAALDALQLM